MQISIIIVNYNVKYFLEHCLMSVMRATQNLDAEIIVVDNCSSDDSAAMVSQKFPSVVLIANKDNIGFARANNQALRKAKGDYILYLNPDTIVPEDCFVQCLNYMEAHPEAGALGCRLIDGKGQFLPESKRGFPSAQVAFFKISGLSGLFKQSKLFNQYHLGYLPEHEINEVDVLVGCFMFCRKSVIDKIGGFDEDYFMYGEDIDLSYKIKLAGYKNVYFPDTTVIHYKGESTAKGSLNYVRMFYKAMIIFARKHFSSGKKSTYVALIQLAIYVRAILTLLTNVFTKIKLPLLDAGLLLLSLLTIKTIWINNIKTETRYSSGLLLTFFIAYIVVWLSAIYLNGGYDKPYKPSRLMRGMLLGAIVTLMIYGLLPESIRFSRGITVLSALLGTLSLLGVRKIMQWLGVKQVEQDNSHNRKVLIVGAPDDEAEIKTLLSSAYIDKKIMGAISPFLVKEPFQLGTFPQTVAMTKLYGITEVIYGQHHLSFKEIIDSIQACGSKLEYKIHSYGTDSIIGSNSKNTAGDLYTTELIYRIHTVEAKRNKRLLDIIFSLMFLLASPLLFWFVRDKKNYFLNNFLVLEGDKTFVGYNDPQFPRLKPHLFTVYPTIAGFDIPEDNKEHLNWLYAKNYDPWHDVKLILDKWREL